MHVTSRNREDCTHVQLNGKKQKETESLLLLKSEKVVKTNAWTKQKYIQFFSLLKRTQ